MTNISCLNCINLDYVKETYRGEEPICGLPGTPKSWNEELMMYQDSAKSCVDYERR